MKHLSFYLTVFLAVVFAVPAFAGGGNGAPSGPHYNLNLIGMEKGKYPDMTNSNRHTIFIALNNQAGATARSISPRANSRSVTGTAMMRLGIVTESRSALLVPSFSFPATSTFPPISPAVVESTLELMRSGQGRSESREDRVR
jgi:hypothetical protein